MGYSTAFSGQFDLDKQLTLDDYRYLNEFSEINHHEQDYCPEYGYYCQWVPTEDGRGIKWDEEEKFSAYVEWLQYLIDEFFTPHGYIITGQVSYQGEQVGDCGVIKIEDGKAKQIEYEPQKADIKELVKKGLDECENEGGAYWYLEQIAKKLGIKIK